MTNLIYDQIIAISSYLFFPNFILILLTITNNFIFYRNF